MSTPDAAGGANAALEAIITLTDKLTGLLADQARAFEQHRPQDAAQALDEVSRLTNIYRTASAHVRSQPNMIENAPDDLRRRLLRATEAFDAVLERQGRALAASKTVTEGLVKTDFVAARCESDAFERWSKFVSEARNSPEASESITGVPAAEVRAAARLYATGGNGAIYYGLGVTKLATQNSL